MIAYCRDKNNWWKTELTLKQPAKTLSGEKVSFTKFVKGGKSVDIYQPVADKSMSASVDSDGNIVLPDFLRATVVRIKK